MLISDINTDPRDPGSGTITVLKDRLREVLLDQALTTKLTTYKCLADRLGLIPPQTIHRITDALEVLMKEDAEAGRPLLAAFCVSRLGSGLPARGFFMTAEALGLFTGDPESPEADAFYTRELKRALDFYGQS